MFKISASLMVVFLHLSCFTQVCYESSVLFMSNRQFEMRCLLVVTLKQKLNLGRH